MRCNVFCSLALASVVLLPSQAMAETLRNAVLKALGQHPTVEAALAVEKRIQEEQKEERAGFFPEINASATGGRIFGDNSTTRGLVVDRGEAYSYLWEGSASITQPIFDGLQTFNRVDAAKARLAAQEHSVTDIRQNLALRATQAYLNVLRAREALYSIENYRDTLNAYQDRIKLMVDEGAADEAEAAQAKNIALLLEDSLAEFEGQVQAAEAEYIELVGHMPDGKLQEPEIMNFELYDSVDAAVDYAKVNHPILKSARKELEAAGYDSEAEEGTLFPEIDGELSYLKRDQVEEIGGEVLDQRAIVRMNWSFSLGGAELARIRQTKAEYSEALANLQSSQREIVRDVRRSYALYETVKKQNELLKERQEITEDLFDTYKVQFEGARVSLLQLMQTENQMFNTQLEAINTYFQYLTSHYTLLASMGDLLKHLNLGGEEVQTFEYPRAQSVVSEPEPQIVKAKMEPIAPVVVETEQPVIQREQIYPAVVQSEPTEAILEPMEISDHAPEHGIQITDQNEVQEPMELEIKEPEPLIEEPKIEMPAKQIQPAPEPREQIYPVEDYPQETDSLWP
ncbi:MAG: TolC family protein [Pseudomonadota bacterium]